MNTGDARCTCDAPTEKTGAQTRTGGAYITGAAGAYTWTGGGTYTGAAT